MSELVIGQITKITKDLADDYKTLFYISSSMKCDHRKDNGDIICKAYRSSLHLNMPVELYGSWEDDVFNVDEIKVAWLDKKTTISYIISKAKGSGVGKKKAEALVDKYGREVLTMERAVLRNKMVEDFKGMSVSSIDKFINLYYMESHIVDLERLLLPYKVKYETINSIYDEYEDEAIKLFEKDPYTMCLKFDLTRFVAENIAKSYSIKWNDKRRLEGLIGYAIKNSASSGHTYMEAAMLTRNVNKASKMRPYRTRIPALLICNTILSSSKFHFDANNGFVSFKRYHDAEINIANRLKMIDSSFVSHITITDELIKKVEELLHFTFGKDQRNAFKVLESHGVNIIDGGPGTGKSTMIIGIVTLFLMFNPAATIRFCAPTGRAAKRLAECTGFNAMTIHKMVEFTPFNKESALRNQNNPIEADYIIMDETSMADVELLSMLLSATKDGTRLLFVGDKNQLPSVGPGSCLRDIINSGQFPVYSLEENYRQEDEGSILDNAKRILKGSMPMKSDTFSIVKVNDDGDAFNFLCKMMRKYYDIDNPFSCQLIEPAKVGKAGTWNMNRYIHSLVHKDNIDPTITIGDKIMFRRNVYIEENEDLNKAVPLYVNGEMSIVTHMTKDEIIVYDGVDEKVLPASAICDMELAYAYTIHKAQGSEADTIIVYLPEDMNHMLTRSILYTAATRAKKNVIIVYSGEALQDCINNTSDWNRKTRLCERLIANIMVA